MRYIKFRAWDKADLWMHHEIEHGILFSDGSVFDFNDFLNNSGYHEFIIEQFTGLTDKNGKEIYEGDICSFVVFDCFGSDTTFIAIIIYEPSTYMLKTINPKKIDNEYFELDIVRANDDEFEIIGNIHENTELLK